MINWKESHMRILLTNDDGIFAEGLWTLAGELKSVAQVTVVAPDREQSAVGTAVTLWQPLRLREVNPMVPEVETYVVEGTPSDSVILALDGLLKGKVDLVISGINHGLNLGDDVYISGTVAAALQGYLHGIPSLAISTARGNSHLAIGAKLAALIAQKIAQSSLDNLLLNINLPNLPLDKIGGIQLTRLATKSHINSVEEGFDGKRKYYWLVRQGDNEPSEIETDIWAIKQGNISITPLSSTLSHSSPPPLLDDLCSNLLQELKRG
jgi:5'-nucleotidase